MKPKAEAERARPKRRPRKPPLQGSPEHNNELHLRGWIASVRAAVEHETAIRQGLCTDAHSDGLRAVTVRKRSSALRFHPNLDLAYLLSGLERVLEGDPNPFRLPRQPRGIKPTLSANDLIDAVERAIGWQLLGLPLTEAFEREAERRHVSASVIRDAFYDESVALCAGYAFTQAAEAAGLRLHAED